MWADLLKLFANIGAAGATISLHADARLVRRDLHRDLHDANCFEAAIGRRDEIRLGFPTRSAPGGLPV